MADGVALLGLDYWVRADLVRSGFASVYLYLYTYIYRYRVSVVFAKRAEREDEGADGAVSNTGCARIWIVGLGFIGVLR